MSKLTPADVTIITVSYNSSDVLKTMLASVPAACSVIIVDNASDDLDPLQELAEAHGALVLSLPENIGFGRACNAGAQAASTEFLFFLNPDTRLAEGAIDALLEASQRHSETSAFSPKISNANGTPYFKRRSVLLPKAQWLPRGWPVGEVEVPVLSGSAIFVRKAHFAPFDPQIFMYHEDDDWSIKHAQTTGPLLFIPDAEVMHDSGNSSGRAPQTANFKAYHLGRSRVYAMKKHGVPFASLRSRIAAGAGLLSPLTLLSKRKRAKAFGYWRGVTSVEKSPNYKRSKIRKELTRVIKQITGLPYDTYHKLTATRRYDRLTSKKAVVHTGDQARGNKVAIYLIFPKDGVLASHEQAIAYIRAAGYTTFCVSNLPLSDSDRAKLKATCWQVMERPNVGYDFGGYRDAVINMKTDLAALDRLVILNDSTWFPLGVKTNWLTAAEDLGVDFAGAASSYGIRRVAHEKFMDIKWEFRVENRNFHYGSYALSIGPTLLRAPLFFPFWENMKLTEDKNKVVRRGEIALSQLAIKNGFTHGATADLRELPKQLANLSVPTLKNLAQELIFWEQPQMKTVHANALETSNTASEIEARAILEKLILAVVARYGAFYAAPRLMIEHFGFQFLKKTPVKANKPNSDTLKKVAGSISGPAAAAINHEVDIMRAAHFPD